MTMNEFANEIAFGLESLDAVYQHITQFAREADSTLKTSALTYECLGYYNAIEHLMIRTLKYLEADIPSGPFSHRDTLRLFLQVAPQDSLDPQVVTVIEDLMAFRHVATKIYGFLVNWPKLQVIVDEISVFHPRIRELFIRLLPRGWEKAGEIWQLKW